MTNTLVIRSTHADLGMPVSGRVRVPSLRALVSAPGQSWVVDGPAAMAVRANGIAVATGAFPGAHAWSPPD